MKTQSRIPFKVFFLFFFLLLTHNLTLNTVLAQVPQEFNYQAVARNGDAVLNDATIDVKFDILQGSEAGSSVWSEVHSNVTTNALGLFNLKVGSVTALTVDWTAGPYFLKVQLDLGTGFHDFGSSELLSVPYALNSQSVSSLDKLGIRGDAGMDPDSALFEVKRNDGQTVFAVYNSGVRIYVEEETGKGSSRGGFAVGGFRPGKASVPTGEYFRVTSDSVRIYLDDSPGKKSRGGFAVGGFTPGKGTMNQEYLRVTEDSTRIYIDNTATKKSRGGFAVGGFRPGKAGEEEHYFNISTEDEAGVINPSEARILWYPKKEAFLTGRVLIESSDSVGQNSMATGYESKSIGDFSQALGYRAIAKGDNSTAIGNNAYAEGNESYAIGNYALTTKDGSYAIGSGASATGLRSFAIGSVGVDSAGVATDATSASGDYAYAFGMGSTASGQGAFAVGTQNSAIGDYSLAMGYNTEASALMSTAIGSRNVAGGNVSTAMGYMTTASGYLSTTMGERTLASGTTSTALGSETKATGPRTLAAGQGSIANGINSVALGSFTKTYGGSSFAVGSFASTYGSFSAAIGGTTRANGNYSLATGASSISNGLASVATGYHTQANGDFSFSLGYYTVAKPYASFVIGKYNEVNGTTNSWISTEPLFIAGNGEYDAFSNALVLYKNGNLTISGTLTQNSDMRLKTDIASLANVLDDLMKVYPVSYKFKNSNIHPSGKQIGLIAQDIEPIFPELVVKDEKGYLSLDYSKLSVFLIKGMQEQQIVIDQMQEKINQLESERSELALLKEEMEELKAMMNMVSENK